MLLCAQYMDSCIITCRACHFMCCAYLNACKEHVQWSACVFPCIPMYFHIFPLILMYSRGLPSDGLHVSLCMFTFCRDIRVFPCIYTHCDVLSQNPHVCSRLSLRSPCMFVSFHILDITNPFTTQKSKH